MHISFVEIQNFRKLKSIRIDFSKTTTVFVGANNSGKTSAMVALGHFLIHQSHFTTHDFTLSNWALINAIGERWVSLSKQHAYSPDLIEWNQILPLLDLWIHVEQTEIHHVCHLIPTLSWAGGNLGVRLRLEPKDITDLYKEYIAARESAEKTKDTAKAQSPEKSYIVNLWPTTLCEFLERRLHSHFIIRSYSLDPTKLAQPVEGVASPQALSASSICSDGNPLKELIRIDEVTAQRGFTDFTGVANNSDDADGGHARSNKRKLSEQLRSYYSRHIDPSEMPEPSDVDALEAIASAQIQFDQRLREGFALAFREVEGLGYPGVTDLELLLTTQIRPLDGLTHPTALQYRVLSGTTDMPCLPEQYNGLGYQNLISMVFMLMSFRDQWMQVGKAGRKAAAKPHLTTLPPLHLVLVEEPEAHLHAQVQQVFIRKAYEILRAHEDLGSKESLRTQLIVTTHSSHIAHESDFSSLRYFRRRPVFQAGEVPTSTVVNLSGFFGDQSATDRFVTRYLKSTHCDLFFADAAILVEGPAERMLVPHFIREHFETLTTCYITILEIGGNHAHRLRELIEHLGLVTLIITDLDATQTTIDNKKPAVQPARGQGQSSGNMTLRSWVPKVTAIDELLDVAPADKIKRCDDFCSIRVAYQHPVMIDFAGDDTEVEALSNTFEDALVFENLLLFKALTGSGLVKKIRKGIETSATVDLLGQAIFKALKTGDKAEFALNLFYLPALNQLKTPTYIHDGLVWLQAQLQRKQLEQLVDSEVPILLPPVSSN